MIFRLHPGSFPTISIDLQSVPRVDEVIIVKTSYLKDICCTVYTVKYTYFADGELAGKSVIDIYATAEEI